MNSNTNPQQQSRLQLWLEDDDDGGAAVDDDEGDDALSSEDPRSSPDVVFSKVPSLDLIWGGVSLFCGVVCLRSLCRLREMKVFEEAVLLARRTGGRYRRAPRTDAR